MFVGNPGRNDLNFFQKIMSDPIKLITSKLTKGTDYSNENGLTASIPSTAFGRSFQSMKTDKILNQFCFRLSYDENKNGEDRNYIFLPFYR